VDLPSRLVELMGGPNPCFFTTLMPDGSPQTTETWVDTDGEHLIINTVQSHQKMRNIERDPRVSVAICADPSRYYAVRGHATNITTDGGAEHIEFLSQRYSGGPYPWYGQRDQIRVILTITPG
jgi:PPOX class probable F420-dependent enzyme